MAINININGRDITAREGQTIIEVANEYGIFIPTLCHDARVKMYGSCGVCVVEMEGSHKLLRACSTLVSNGMILNSESKKAVATRRSALELLLSDHTGDCRPPCVIACPGGTDCQGYVGLIANGEYKQAIEVMKEQLPLPASIGRICPHPCENACRRKLVDEPISIAQLKYFVGDIDLHSGDTYIAEIGEPTGKKVAVIGGGPGGLSAAYFLRKHGHDVTIYDAMPEMGGMLRYGVPEYRLPKHILAEETRLMSDMGIKMKNNIRIGDTITLERLQSENDAVVVAIGAWKSAKLGCLGEDLENVIGGIDFLRDIHFNEMDLTGKCVAVVGGGNVAMDACRTAVRLGADEVYIVYRRTKAEMPAEEIEIEEAEEEGVIFKYLSNPIEIIGENGAVSEIKLQKMELGKPDASGRRSPIPVEGVVENIVLDMVIIAIGSINNNAGFEELELTKKKTIAADETTFRTNIEGIFAIGDATNKGADIAISAIGEAKKAADVIDRYLQGENIPYHTPYLVKNELTAEDFADKPKQPRVKMRCKPANERIKNFDEVNCGYNIEEAVTEAKRCLECGCHDYFECKLIDFANRYDAAPEKFAGAVNEKPIQDEHPYITRNMNKCILCGLCIRVCDETMGITALGLVDRGFGTEVKPAMDNALIDSGCISCGQCIAVCPTGALGEKLTPIGYKQVPVKDRQTLTTCAQCGVGCQSVLSTKGNMHLRCLPIEGELLCEKGRFGFIENEKKKRILTPKVRKNGVLTDVGYDEACITLMKKLSGFTSEEIAVSISDKLTNEEMHMIKQFANKTLKTENVFSFAYTASGIKEIFGVDGSLNSYDELPHTDVILLFADDIMSSHTILGVKLKQAKENGAKLIVVQKRENMLSEFADIAILTEDYDDILLQIESDSEEIEIANIYKTAKKAIAVFVQNDLSFEQQVRLAELVKARGNSREAKNGIIQLKPNANSQGLIDIGICQNANIFNSGKIKGLITFGEEVPEKIIQTLEFICVQSVYESDWIKKADVVLTGMSLIEQKGTYTNSDGRVQPLNPAVKHKTGLSTIEILNTLMDIVSVSSV